MEELLKIKCEPCRKDVPPLKEEEMARMLPQIPEWNLVKRDNIHQLERIFKFRDFAEALLFTKRVGELAEAEGHHPALITEWGRVTVRWWTHKIKGLHQNDFIMAARTDRLYSS